MSRKLAVFLAVILLGSPLWGYSQSKKKQGKADIEALKKEESENYYDKWLKEEVKYIIASEEESVFKKLTTDEEKEQFIERFWNPRDPDLLTPTNELKEEHYRRIAYANERF